MTVRLSAREFAALVRPSREQAYAARRAAGQAKRKYGNHEVTTAKGEHFDSKAEYRRFLQLEQMRRAGLITNLRRQVPYELIPEQIEPGGRKIRPVVYVADFVYTDDSGMEVVEDPKGCATAEWRIKRKLMLAVHGIWVREIKA